MSDPKKNRQSVNPYTKGNDGETPLSRKFDEDRRLERIALARDGPPMATDSQGMIEQRSFQQAQIPLEGQLSTPPSVHPRTLPGQLSPQESGSGSSQTKKGGTASSPELDPGQHSAESKLPPIRIPVYNPGSPHYDKRGQPPAASPENRSPRPLVKQTGLFKATSPPGPWRASQGISPPASLPRQRAASSTAATPSMSTSPPGIIPAIGPRGRGRAASLSRPSPAPPLGLYNPPRTRYSTSGSLSGAVFQRSDYSIPPRADDGRSPPKKRLKRRTAQEPSSAAVPKNKASSLGAEKEEEIDIDDADSDPVSEDDDEKAMPDSKKGDRGKKSKKKKNKKEEKYDFEGKKSGSGDKGKSL